MQLKSLDFYFSCFAEEQMNFLYTGDFSDEHTDGFIQLNNHQYNASDEFKKSQRKAGFLIAECFQNIVRHHEPSHRNSFFNIKNDQGILSIISGNTVTNEIIPGLKTQLELLNQLTSEELKEKYRAILADGEYSEKGGAGLGLIEIARRSKNKLSFSFEELDDSHSYFYFGLNLSLNDTESALPFQHFENSVDLRNQMLLDNLFFVYKGVISIQTTIIILGIIENTLDSMLQKVVFVKFMGLFERLSRTSIPGLKQNNCLLLIGETEEEYSIATSCYLNQNEARRLSRISSLYEMLDREELDKEYKKLIEDKEAQEVHTNNIDLIELLKSSSKFEINMQSLDGNLAMLQLVLTFQKKKKSKIQFYNSETKEQKAQPSLKQVANNQ